MTNTMTKTERGELISLIKANARVAKAMASQRSAEVMADFERQLDTIYSFDEDEIWKKAWSAADQAVNDAKEAVAERCQELGIPKEFAPSISVGWWGQGQNASKERRADLRRMAVTRIAADEKSSRVVIEKYSVDLQTKIVAEGLTSESAKLFLEAMPAIETLMPTLDATEIKGLLGHAA